MGFSCTEGSNPSLSAMPAAAMLVAVAAEEDDEDP
jgi:hypothetical protein